MEILPVYPVRIVEPTRHEDQQLPKRRQPPRKKDNVKPGAVYTPDGHVEDNGAHKIDIVA
jgi:hypothetical protein